MYRIGTIAFDYYSTHNVGQIDDFECIDEFGKFGDEDVLHFALENPAQCLGFIAMLSPFRRLWDD